MNIIVTGGNGFVGKELISFLKKEHVIFNLELNQNADVDNNISIDLSDTHKVRKYFEVFKENNTIDIIIHLASKLASAETIYDVDILQYNIKLYESIVIISKLLKPNKIINFSSSAVYSCRNAISNEVSEIRPSTNPDCLYGLSKICGENILDFMLGDQDIVVSHLRISQIYGEHMREDRIIPSMLHELHHNNTITVFGNGKRNINFIHIRKLVNVVNQFIKNDLKGIYNVGDEQLTLLTLAEKLIKRHGNKASKIITKENGSRIDTILDDSKFRAIINSHMRNNR
ncbi:MAG: NAD-dependent epimerase/dehydratase family protein [Elusimicrobia bacterium]|nr:NAD-dependent epimerase/dehydratase family protein [Elusimicrobiota bacterium]